MMTVVVAQWRQVIEKVEQMTARLVLVPERATIGQLLLVTLMVVLVVQLRQLVEFEMMTAKLVLLLERETIGQFSLVMMTMAALFV